MLGYVIDENGNVLAGTIIDVDIDHKWVRIVVNDVEITVNGFRVFHVEG